MRYLVDGYNFLFRCPETPGSLEERRELLIASFVEYASKKRERISLVFDAPFQNEEESRGHKGSLEIIYTANGQSADQYILHTIQIAKNPRKLIVVSSDLRLAQMVTSSGAWSETVEAFSLRMGKTLVRKKKAQEPSFPPSEMDRWLQIFEKKLREQE